MWRCVNLYSLDHVEVSAAAFDEDEFQRYVDTVKVKLSQCTPRRHRGGVELELHSFLPSALGRGPHLRCGKIFRCLLNMRLGYAPNPGWTFWIRDIFFLPLLRFKTRIFQPVAWSLWWLSYPASCKALSNRKNRRCFGRFYVDVLSSPELLITPLVRRKP